MDLVSVIVPVYNVEKYLQNYPKSITKSRFTVKKVMDYWEGLKFTVDYFQKNSKDLRFIKNRLISNILKSQLSYIETGQNRIELVAAFAKELKWIKKNNLLSLWHNRIIRLYKYYKIMY